jgi:predicted acetyltransferase
VSARPTTVTVTVAQPDELVLVERLWQLYRHDLSEFRDMLPQADGLFRPGRLPAHVDDDGNAVYLVRADGAPAGFVLVGGLHAEEHTVSELFVVRAVRRYGVGRQVALDVLRRHPGRWFVGFQEENPGAARFWRRLATEVAGDTWTEERVPVPDKPWLPLDVVLHLVVPPESADG